MVRFYHLSILLLAGLAAATAMAADLPGGKKVTITVMYPAADLPGKNTRISVRYTDEGHRIHDQFQLDCDNDEFLGMAVQYFLTTMEQQRDYEKAYRYEL